MAAPASRKPAAARSTAARIATPSTTTLKTAAPSARPGARSPVAKTTRENLLRAAIKVFARHGFAGGRIEQISKAAGSYDRMIYYYFGSKEGLFIAVIEEIYRRFNEAESQLELSPDQPVESLEAFIGFIWSYYRKHPEFISLLNSENLHRGKHISKSMRAEEYSSQAIAVLEQVLESGAARNLFRADLRARDVYLLIASTCYFYLSNRHTLSAFLGEELETPEALAYWERFIVDSVIRVVTQSTAKLGE